MIVGNSGVKVEYAVHYILEKPLHFLVSRTMAPSPPSSSVGPVNLQGADTWQTWLKLWTFTGADGPTLPWGPKLIMGARTSWALPALVMDRDAEEGG